MTQHVPQASRATAPSTQSASVHRPATAAAETTANATTKRLRAVHTLLALLAVVLSVASLTGWLLGVPALHRFIPGRPSLSPMTAIVLIVAAWGAVSLPRRTRCAQLLGAVQIASGLSIVAAHGWGVPGRLPFPVEWWSSMLSGAVFVASGLSTVLLAAQRVVAGQLVAIGVLLLAVLMGFAHVFPQADLYAYVPGTGVAIPTVIALGALSISQLAACKHAGLVGALTSRSAVGRAGRLLLSAGSVAVFGIAVAVVMALRAELFDAETAILLVAWGAIVALGGTLWSLALAMDRAELARASAERERDQMRHMVAAAVTHDLRSPLQVASLSATLLERWAREPQAQAAVDRLKRSTRRLDRLLRSLLDSLAFEKGRPLPLRPEPLAVHGLVAEVLEENASTLAGRVRCDGEAEACWDHDTVFRVIENLLLNAVKYGDATSPIALRIAQVADDAVALTVENQGAPIDPADWELIFEPFSRAQAARDGQQAGWGVGLAFARSVAAAHGGSIRVARSDAQRTVFEMQLPRDARRVAPPGAKTR